MNRILDIISILICLLGTFIVSADSISWGNKIIDKCTYWGDIDKDVERLDRFNFVYAGTDIRIGVIDKSEKGFNEIAQIISHDRQVTKKIIYIVQGGMVRLAMDHINTISVVYEGDNTSRPITNDTDFKEWLKNARERDLTKWGIWVIAFGTILSIFSRIISDRKKNEHSLPSFPY